jgi:hypothetical protein
MGRARDRIGVLSEQATTITEGHRGIKLTRLHQGGGQRIRIRPSAVCAARWRAQPQNLFGDLEQESHRTPHGFAQYRGFSDGLRNAPSAYGARRKEGELSRAEATFNAVLAGNERFARNDYHGFVLAIAPLELTRCAIPNDDVRSVVAAGRQLVAAGGRSATDYPFGPNRFGPKLDVLRFDHQNWLSHFPQLGIPQLKQNCAKSATHTNA